MQQYKQKDIRNDEDFKSRHLQGYEEVRSFEELEGLPGSFVRYKVQHLRTDGSNDVLYRLGGLCTHVDKSHEYITLKNKYAEKKGNFSNAWSVQLRYQMKKEPGTKEAFYIPVIPKWQADKGENIHSIQKLINSSRHGVIIITLYSNKSKNSEKDEEISKLKQLIERLEKQDSESKRRPSPDISKRIPVVDRPINARSTPTYESNVKSKAFGMFI